MNQYTIPPRGSLGLLALGHVGLDRWREVRGTAWIEEQRRALAERDAAAAPSPALSSDLDLVIVTGLPRSGTSMVMQMLVAGGIPPFADDERVADESNPKGYFEHDRVRALAADASWIPEADGHALKVVAPLAVHLPAGPRYRVVMVERDLTEVLRSQAAMIQRSDGAAAEAAVLRPAFERFLTATREWAERAEAVELLTLQHADVLAAPESAAKRLAAFASTPNRPLDSPAMAAVVDPSLYRSRS